MKPNDTPEAVLNRKGRKVLLLSLLVTAGAFVIQVLGFIAVMILKLPEDGLATTTVIQAFSVAGGVLGMLLLGGASWLSTSREDISDAFRTSRVIIIADILIFGISLVSIAIEGSQIAPDWPINLALTALVCLGIGIAEEVAFRGIYLNGILAVAGKSHRGTMWGVAITSLLFGLAHVDVSADFAEPLLAAQAILKIVQTGLFSVIFCSVVMRTHRLGGVALVHGLSDFLLMAPSIVLIGEDLDPQYVSTGEEGISSIILYSVIIAIYLPIAIKAIRRMRREQVTYRGAFMERAVREYEEALAQGVPATDASPHAAQVVATDGSAEHDRQGLPVPPEGFE